MSKPRLPALGREEIPQRPQGSQRNPLILAVASCRHGRPLGRRPPRSVRSAALCPQMTPRGRPRWERIPGRFCSLRWGKDLGCVGVRRWESRSAAAGAAAAIGVRCGHDSRPSLGVCRAASRGRSPLSGSDLHRSPSAAAFPQPCDVQLGHCWPQQPARCFGCCCCWAAVLQLESDGEQQPTLSQPKKIMKQQGICRERLTRVFTQEKGLCRGAR